MNPYEELERRACDAAGLDESALVLNELFTGGYAVWSDGRLYSIKQLVGRINGLQIHVYADEHAPPHFHVVGPDLEASFAVADCSFLRGNIDGREQRLVEWWYARSRPQLIAAWNSTRPTDCPVGPADA